MFFSFSVGRGLGPDASVPAQNPGSIMMPSTLIRWPLLFISGVFIPLGEMESWARALSFFSPLTYAQDLFEHAVTGVGTQALLLDLVALPIQLAVFLVVALRLHALSRRMGY